MTTFFGIAFETIVVLVLVVANGFFVAAEFALVKVRASQLRPLSKTGGWRVKFALKATDHLDAALSATHRRRQIQRDLTHEWTGSGRFQSHDRSPLF